MVADGGLNVFIDTGHIPQVRVKVPSLTHKKTGPTTLLALNTMQNDVLK